MRIIFKNGNSNCTAVGNWLKVQLKEASKPLSQVLSVYCDIKDLFSVALL